MVLSLRPAALMRPVPPDRSKSPSQCELIKILCCKTLAQNKPEVKTVYNPGALVRF